MFENPRRGRQERNFTTNVPKILVLKSSSEQIFSRKLPLGAPDSPEYIKHLVTSQQFLVPRADKGRGLNTFRNFKRSKYKASEVFTEQYKNFK